jgi:hypothetical protein
MAACTKRTGFDLDNFRAKLALPLHRTPKANLC